MPSRSELEYLRSGHLVLPDVSNNYDNLYANAFMLQAVPVVDFLVRINEAGIKRIDKTIATYSSPKNSSIIDAWNRNLARAVCDVGNAAGIRISARDKAEPRDLEEASSYLERPKLPPELRSRINLVNRAPNIISIAAHRKPNEPALLRQPQGMYNLEITTEQDPDSYTPDFKGSDWSFTRSIHRVRIMNLTCSPGRFMMEDED